MLVICFKNFFPPSVKYGKIYLVGLLCAYEKDVILITYHGKVVAKMSAAEPDTLANESESAWISLEKLAAEIGKNWPEGVSALDALAEDRK